MHLDHVDILQQCTGFDWDEGNLLKNWLKHRVRSTECEQVFFNQPLLVHTDSKHSSKEPRYYVLGVTDNGRTLFMVITVRSTLIRVISARAMSR
ncbi:MAG: BrnT family toxin [Bacteroidetes bacterium]|nr:BrnT family toxin [Bacteroidota bacterium]